MKLDRFKEIVALFAHGTSLDTVRGWGRHEPEEAFLPWLVEEGPVMRTSDQNRKIATDFRTYSRAFLDFVDRRDPAVLGGSREEVLQVYRALWTGFLALAS